MHPPIRVLGFAYSVLMCWQLVVASVTMKKVPVEMGMGMEMEMVVSHLGRCCGMESTVAKSETMQWEQLAPTRIKSSKVDEETRFASICVVLRTPQHMKMTTKSSTISSSSLLIMGETRDDLWT